MKYIGKSSVLVAAAVLMSASTAFAQRNAAAKANGDYGWPASTARANSNVRSYSYAPAYNNAPATRTFSYAPQPQAQNRQPVQMAPSTAVPSPPVQRPVAPARRFSYQPAAPVYRQPMNGNSNRRLQGWHDAGTKANFDYH